MTETPFDHPKLGFPLDHYDAAMSWAVSRAPVRGVRQRLYRVDVNGQAYWCVRDGCDHDWVELRTLGDTSWTETCSRCRATRPGPAVVAKPSG